jgi:hypothetical protein
MNILKETQYLRFIEFEKKEKTRVIAVMNKHHEEVIGMIKWFSRWRQYCFFPTNETVWNINCLNDVNEVITMLADERKKKAIVEPIKTYRTIGVIAETIADFQTWKTLQGHEVKFGNKDTLRIYESDNTKYVCLSKKEHCCSWTFDEILETNDAKKNPDYAEIIEYTNVFSKDYKKKGAEPSGMDADVLKRKIFPSEKDFYFKD